MRPLLNILHPQSLFSSFGSSSSHKIPCLIVHVSPFYGIPPSLRFQTALTAYRNTKSKYPAALVKPDETRSASFVCLRAATNGKASISAFLVPSHKYTRKRPPLSPYPREQKNQIPQSTPFFATLMESGFACRTVTIQFFQYYPVMSSIIP